MSAIAWQVGDNSATTNVSWVDAPQGRFIN
jgi:hypothetical protein